MLLLIGITVLVGFYGGKGIKIIKLPSVIGFMVIGVIFGPSLLNLLSNDIQSSLGFITEICLGFVALTIGLELKFSTLKEQGIGMVLIILFESFLAFFVVTGVIYLLTKDLAISLIFGSIAPASAPAGTVAVIQEFRSKGPVTKALYTVVGVDDGLGIIIFGFAFAFAKSILSKEAGIDAQQGILLLLEPLKEIGLSVLIGVALAFIFKLLTLKLKSARDIFILTFSMVIIGCGLSSLLHLSLILTNMIIGMTIINSSSKQLITNMSNKIEEIMPLMFVLFFILAGANLNILQLPALGLLGIVYMGGRTVGLMGGSYLGALIGKSDKNIRNYLGAGILSQAGVAIGLSLIVKQEFSNISEHGQQIGVTIITVITATSIIFGIIGPITTKWGLQKAGEIELKPKKG